MNKWLGLAATQYSKFTKTVGATVAASTLTSVLNLQDDGPSIWEILGRIAVAFGEILFHWPEGVEVNATSIIIQLLKAADLVDVGAKFETFITTITQVPPIQDTIFGYIIMAAMGPAWALFFYHSARYWRNYRKILQTPGGEDRIWGDQAEILNPSAWLVQRFLLMFGIMAALTAITIGPQLLVNITWNAMNAIVQVFYTGAGTTIGGVFVELISRMAEAGIFQFLLSFVILFAGGLFLLFHYGIRLFRFVWGHVLFAWRSPRTLAGERHVTLAEPVRMWAERMVELVLTAFFILVGPLLLSLIPEITGLPIAAGLLAIFWAAWKFPPEVTEHWQEYYQRFGNWFEGGLFSPQAGPPPPPPPKRPGAFDRLGGIAMDYAKQDPSYRDIAAAASALRGVPQRGVGQSAMENPSYNPQSDAVQRIPKKLYQRRNTLHTDTEVNNAIFAYLADTFARSKPMRPLDDLIVQAKWEVAGLQKRSEPSFTALAERGGELKEAAELKKKDYKP